MLQRVIALLDMMLGMRSFPCNRLYTLGWRHTLHEPTNATSTDPSRIVRRGAAGVADDPDVGIGDPAANTAAQARHCDGLY